MPLPNPDQSYLLFIIFIADAVYSQQLRSIPVDDGERAILYDST
jgi:hypothetical protein